MPKIQEHAQSIYVSELWALALSIIRKCERVFSDCPYAASFPPGYIKPDNELNFLIGSIFTDAANICKLLKEGTKNQYDTTDSYRYRCDRCSAIKEILKDVRLDEITKVEMRHTIEHFDQKLDRAILSLKPKQWIAYNMTISSWEVIDQPRRDLVYPIKVYVANEHTYYNLGWKSNLDKIKREAELINTAIRNSPLTDKRDDGAGGCWIF